MMRFTLGFSSKVMILMCGAILLAITFNGCKYSNVESSKSQADLGDLPILWEKSGTYSRLTRPSRILVRDFATLAQIPIAEVEVDFDTQMLLIAGLGPTSRSDVGVRITRVWVEGNRIRVQERQIHPGLHDVWTIEPASPWTMVAIPRQDLDVEGYSSRIPRGMLGEHQGSR